MFVWFNLVHCPESPIDVFLLYCCSVLVVVTFPFPFPFQNLSSAVTSSSPFHLPSWLSNLFFSKTGELAHNYICETAYFRADSLGSEGKHWFLLKSSERQRMWIFFLLNVSFHECFTFREYLDTNHTIGRKMRNWKKSHADNDWNVPHIRHVWTKSSDKRSDKTSEVPRTMIGKAWTSMVDALDKFGRVSFALRSVP